MPVSDGIVPRREFTSPLSIKLCASLLFFFGCQFSSAVTYASAHNKSIAESITIKLMPDRVVRIQTPWANYVAYDRGVEPVWVGTTGDFDNQRLEGFIAPDNRHNGTGISVNVGNAVLTHLSLDVMYNLNAKTTKRPPLPSGMSYVVMQWQPPLAVNPLIFLADLETGAVASSYFSGSTEDVGTEEFLFPARSIMHRTMVIFFSSRGRPSAVAVRSIAWLTVRDYESGQDAWELEAHKLLQKNSGFRSTFRDADIDLKRLNKQIQSSADGPITVVTTPTP